MSEDNWDRDPVKSGSNNAGFEQKPPQSMGRGRFYTDYSAEKNVTFPSNPESSGGNWDNKSESKNDDGNSSSGWGSSNRRDNRNDGDGGFRNKENNWNNSGNGFGNRGGRGGYNRGGGGGGRDYNNSRQWDDKKSDDNGADGFNRNGDDDGNRGRGGFGNRRGRDGDSNFGDRQNRDGDRRGGYRGRNGDSGGFGGRNRDGGDRNNDEDDGGGFGDRKGGGGRGGFRGRGGFGGQNRDGGGSWDKNGDNGGNWGKNDDGGGKWGRNADGDSGGFGGQNRDGDRGGNRGRGGFGGQNRDGGGVNDRNEGRDGDRGGNRGRGGFGGQNRDGGGFGGQNRDGGGFNDRNDRDGGENKDGEAERPPPYCPPKLTNDDLFSDSIPCGLNFSKYKDKQHAKLSGANPIDPINSFEEAKLRQHLVENIKRAGYASPTTVQQYVIPIVMANRDIMACAQTGSGKTAAFLLPILHNLMADKVESAQFQPVQEPYAIIVAPTRELAIQIHKEATKFSHESMVRVGLLYGGTSTGYQLKDLKQGAHIVVATPGRLLDVIDRLAVISLAKLRYLVLDEADRMLEMGFIECIRKIVEHPSIPPKGERNTLMFSATFPLNIQKIANEFLTDYLFLTIGIVGGANGDVNQTFVQADGRSAKNDMLVEILKENFKKEAVIVFVQEKRIADFVCSILCHGNLEATSIHGDRLQHQREQALSDFRTKKFSILVATGVASRGLDIKGVDHVINYDMPRDIDEYVHRIGRTARVGNVGKSTSFVDPKFDEQLIPDLITILKNAEQEIPDWLGSIGGSGNGGGGRQSSQFGGRDYRSTNEQAEWDKPSNSGGGGAAATETWD